VVAVGGITCQITYSTSNPAAPAGRMSYRAICLDLRKKRDRERGRDRGETEGGGQDRRGRWLLSLLWRKGGPGGDGGREFCWREVSGFVRVSSEVLLCAQAATARPSLLPRYPRPLLRLGWMKSRESTQPLVSVLSIVMGSAPVHTAFGRVKRVPLGFYEVLKKT